MTDAERVTDAGEQLPADVTSFVGRRAERAEIRTLLGDSRLVTLTGFGGVGKTRLALKVASELRRAFGDGVCFVPLGSLTDPDWLPDQLATALGLQGRSTRAAPTSIVEYLKGRSMLLVLDNCEHVVDAAAVLTDTILRTCPKVRVLATSREPLRIQGEAVHPVQPLTVPDPHDTSTPLQQFEAVSLFVERAQALVPDFEVTEQNRASVASICRKLEGIPLAIELAAGRLRAMSPQEIEQHLTDQWELLSRGSRTAPDRQRTMAACIEWSASLCTDAERDLWARASVFADGFDLEACRAVCQDDASGEPVTDTLLSLVDKSLVIATDRGLGTRFRMLPPIRQRGIRRLRDLGELTDVRRRHRDWFTELSERAAADWISSRQVTWILRLRQESGNMRTALEFCATEPGEAEPGLRMGANLLEFGLADGLFRPGRIWFSQLLPLSPEPSETRLRALRTACWWATMQGDLEHARPLLDEGLRLAETFDGHPAALMEQAAAFVAMFSGEVEKARDHFERAIEGFREHGDISQQAHSYALLSLDYTFLGDLAAAEQAHQHCLAITEPAGESWFRAYSLWIAGLAAWAAGDGGRGVELERQSLALKQPINDRLGIGTSLVAIAWMVATTDPDRAAVLLGAAQNEWDKIETHPSVLPGLAAFHESSTKALEAAMGSEAYAEAFDRGRALSQSEAVDFAIGRAPAKAAPARRSKGRATSSVLTPRERQIADLVGQGLNNQDIADTLVISKRTAETHVEHILTKLGFTNRHQISAWVGEQASDQ